MEAGIVWFEDSSWIGKQIEFHKPQMRWKITSKILEKECFRTDEEVEDWKVFSQAHAVFVCLNINDPAQEAVLKVRIQIPKWETWSESAETRAQQAAPLYTEETRHEIEALQLLTKANCSSAPKFIASKSEKQGETDWVPGGYMDLILMERVPGSHPGHRGASLRTSVSREERDEIRAAFKNAWLECISCGLYHTDQGLQNILWDRQQKKCYIVDWERWTPIENLPQRNRVWEDWVYPIWNLAIVNGKDLGDMSTWEL